MKIMPDAIECKRLNKTYVSRQVLRDVNLSVPEGVFFGLVGMNGSGKSTMIKSILDLVAIDSGEISLFGKSHRRVSSRSQIAYLPDRFAPPPHLKCRDFIRYMLKLHANRCSSDAIHHMLDSLDLDRDTLNASVSSLSKGMTQKLGIASCLLSGKSLLILDEPMSGLDPKARYLFKQQLFELKRCGITLFYSSHVLADVDELSDQMAVLHQSQIVFTGTTAAFKTAYTENSLEKAYMKCVNTSALVS
jgi:ABC-2 type transport system ATP-binding protein